MRTPMHLKIKKGMLIEIKENQKIVVALVVSDVYLIKKLFHMVDIVSQGKRRKVRTTWIREIYA